MNTRLGHSRPATPETRRRAPVVVEGGHFEFPSWEQFAEAICDASLSAYILKREERPWSLTRYRPASTWIQAGVSGASAASEVQIAPGRAGVLFVARGAAPQFVNGREAPEGTVSLLAPGSLVSISTRQPTRWFALTTSVAGLGRQARLANGNEAASLPNSTLTVPEVPRDAASLEGLATEALRAIEAAPGGMHPEAARNLDRLLVRAVTSFTIDRVSDARRGRPRRVDRCTAIRSIHRFLRSLSSRPVYLEDMCAATGLPERTLRLIFMEQFGQSPVRVLRSRRLCLVYESLQSPDVGLKQIRPVAESFGFWHMGQFSVDYRKLLGERPSDTVRRAREHGPRPATRSRIHDLVSAR